MCIVQNCDVFCKSRLQLSWHVGTVKPYCQAGVLLKAPSHAFQSTVAERCIQAPIHVHVHMYVHVPWMQHQYLHSIRQYVVLFKWLLVYSIHFLYGRCSCVMFYMPYLVCVLSSCSFDLPSLLQCVSTLYLHHLNDTLKALLQTLYWKELSTLQYEGARKSTLMWHPRAHKSEGGSKSV